MRARTDAYTGSLVRCTVSAMGKGANAVGICGNADDVPAGPAAW